MRQSDATERQNRFDTKNTLPNKYTFHLQMIAERMRPREHYTMSS